MIQCLCVYVSASNVCAGVLAPGLQMGSDILYNLSDRQADRETDKRLPPTTLRHLTKAHTICTQSN